MKKERILDFYEHCCVSIVLSNFNYPVLDVDMIYKDNNYDLLAAVYFLFSSLNSLRDLL